MDEQFIKWLTSEDTGPLLLGHGSSSYIFIRVKKNEDFDYLYGQCHYYGNAFQRGDEFKYMGVYYRGDGLVYDAQYTLLHMTDKSGTMEMRSTEALLKLLEQDVRQTVEARINNDRANLRITEVQDERHRGHLDYFCKYSAAGTAREMYLAGKSLSDIYYRCRYSAECWTEEAFLEYIADPDGYAAKVADDYLDEFQESILLQFLENDAVRKEYQALTEQPENPVHCIKQIMDAMLPTTAKTVTITICKDGTEFTFKTEAGELRRDCGKHYSTWHITASDRQKFKRIFGRNSDYTPEEIVRITYGRNTLYEREP